MCSPCDKNYLKKDTNFILVRLLGAFAFLSDWRNVDYASGAAYSYPDILQYQFYWEPCVIRLMYGICEDNEKLWG
jgi:hypothetical protein